MINIKEITVEENLQRLATKGVLGLTPYVPGKPIEELERELGIRDIVKLASNENPLGASKRAIEAAQEVLKDVSLYPDGSGFRLRQALAKKHGVSPAQITLGNGSNDILELIARATLTPDLEAVFSQYSFAIYPIVTQACGAKAVITSAKDWGHDLDQMLAAITDRTRIVFIANPNNPTGTWLKSTALEAFLNAVPEHVVVVLDEAYVEYIADPEYQSADEWINDFPNLLVTRTFSKAYGLAGLRIGYGISHPMLANLLNRVRQPFNVNSIALAAAEAALNDQQHIAESVKMNREGMLQLENAFNAMGLTFIPSVGNFIAVDTKKSSQEVYNALLRKGVIVRPIENYNMPGFIRITIGSRLQNQRFIDAFNQILAS